MYDIRITWDEAKNRSNVRKHGIRFEEAARVFEDPEHISTLDRVVDGEERWQTFGFARGVLLIMVAHTMWEEGAHNLCVRIISARNADRRERRFYESENG